MNEPTFKEKLRGFFSWDLSDLGEDILAKNEVQANKAVAITMFNVDLLLLVMLILHWTGVFSFEARSIPLLLLAGAEFLLPALLCFIRRGRGRWVKYFLLILFLLGLTACYVLENARVILAMLIPMILSCRYYSPKLVAFTSGITLAALFLGALASVAYGVLDMNSIVFGRPMTLFVDGRLYDAVLAADVTKSELYAMALRYSVLPGCLFFTVIAVICVLSASRGQELSRDGVTIIEKNARIGSELDLATSIQANMLPRIFPPFPDHAEFDIYAVMQPAKEVGGDFYDFFMTDDTHIACVIADVSGKGVPAALFMVTAKTLIKDHTQLGLEPAEVFTRVNKELCEGNEAGLFVTGWMGILDIRTGQLRFVNAGHNPPLLFTDGSYRYLTSAPGFVLAGLETVKYRQSEITVRPGDRLFLYTDGVTEAMDPAKKLYGTERLLDFLESHPDDPIQEVIPLLRGDIDAFTGDAEQFDDITMLLLEYRSAGAAGITERVFGAKLKRLPEMHAFLRAEFEKAGADARTVSQIALACEEVFVNIANYAYPGRKGTVKISLTETEDGMDVTFRDSGIPFDPLTRPDPDLTRPASERELGGLGIYMARQNCDAVSYRYADGMNVLTLHKIIRK